MVDERLGSTRGKTMSFPRVQASLFEQFLFFLGMLVGCGDKYGRGRGKEGCVGAEYQ